MMLSVKRIFRFSIFLLMIFVFLSLIWTFLLSVPGFFPKHIAPQQLISNFEDSFSVKLDVMLINQYPELPRGCEVTSLAMLLQSAGINVDKMELARQVKKDTTPYQYEDGQTFFGNPNTGFVGDMYNMQRPGYGVYHGPISKLAEQYLPSKIKNLTGRPFQDVLTSLKNGVPVWAIINTTYKPLPETSFKIWETPKGKIKITKKEHAVLITGYDHDYIYVNDPLEGIKNRALNKKDFIKAWEQMGKQAVTYTK
jgi:uncharacterized protein YvpB